MLGGPFMNIVLALAVPFGMALIQGIPAATGAVIESIKPDGPRQWRDSSPAIE